MAIIGGGIAGLALAAELAELDGRLVDRAGGTRPELRIVLLERENQFSYHSSGRSISSFSESVGGAQQRALTRASRTVLDALGAESGTPLLRTRPIVWVAAQEHLASLNALLTANPSLRPVDLAGAQTLCPVLRPEAVARAAVERTAQDVDVDALLQQYRDRATAAGAILRTAIGLESGVRDGGASAAWHPSGTSSTSNTPATPAPSDTPATPAASATSDARATPAPSDTRANPAPSDTPAASDARATPALSGEPTTPAPSSRPAALAPSGGPARASLPTGPLVSAGSDGVSWRLTTDRGELVAGYVVNAAGPWADAVAARLGADPAGLTNLRRTVAIASAERVGPAWPLVIDVADAYYFRPERGGLLISPADETPSPPTDAVAAPESVALAIERITASTTLRLTRVRTSWAGLRTFAPDRNPIVGPDPNQDGLYWFTALGGTGIQTAPALARLAAAQLLGEPYEIPDLRPEALLPR
ncbi:FAD-dependent oxidoreductase [Dactylosporangium sp. NPDC051485]|uniref:FAD-dependent oxidoreductase n=1 Tax=Dactylosporangium sp. NPDC051485 TaxID=3154846 RepID=UPI0034384CF5